MDLQDRIRNLPPDKRALLEKKLKAKLGNKKRLIYIPRADDGATFPLSFAQQRLWFLYQLDPESPFYNVPSALKLTGSLDIQALKSSINDIIKRHEVLRTVFLSDGKDPVQKIHPDLTIDLPVEDLTQLDNQAQQASIKQLSSEEARKFFRLDQLPLIRCKLLKLGDTEHILIMNIHHIVSDGWSMSVFNKELRTFYAHHTVHAPVPLDALAVQYCDFSVWQRERMRGAVLDEQLYYWTKQLKDAPPLLEMPLDRAYPPLKSYNGARIRCMLPERLTESLQRQKRQYDATLFMYLLTAFNVLLYRYTRQQDIVVGSPIASRTSAEIEPLIGFFVNTLVLRADLSGDPSFRQLLGQVRETTLDAYTHQDLPFEKLVEELKPERSLSYSPLFQVMFVLQSASTETLQLEGLAIQPVAMDSGIEKFDLTVSAEETAGGLCFSWSYNTDIYDQDSIQRMMRHYQVLLEQVVADPDKPVSAYELLTPEERQQLLFDWNATAVAYPGEQSIQALFEAQVARTPEAVAVVWRDLVLSYGELNARANRLAHYLITQGVGPDTLVALCLERSLDLVVAVLGILKAGGAYAPLDPGYPKERLAFMLQDTRAPVLITQSSLQAALPPSEASVLWVDEAVDPLAAYADTNPAVRSQPQHLAYINYTSGSTGQPKGVAIPHQGVTRLVFGANYVSLDASRTLLQMAPVSFDAATFELWGALLHGGRCVLYPEAVPTVDGLKAIIAQHRVDTLWLTAAFFNVIVDTDADALKNVEQVLTGGEALSVTHIRKALQHLKGTRLINGYGPTEGTTFTCCYPIPACLDADLRSIPIGRPISNTQVYVLDDHLQPVPIGVVAELYIGGDGLARGYLNRPELTAERFIANPLAGTPGERLYRSGDRVRYLADGNIEFIGRNDDQVKLRGFRIELGEIEATLRRHPQVQDSVVLVREAGAAGKQLVAYVVAEPTADDLAGTLRDSLKQKLPEYMVPSAFITLAALPLTPTGKVDREALPSPDQQQMNRDGHRVGPRNVTEETLASIWCKLLGLDSVSVYDDFFALGGHSLLSVRLLNKIEQTFGRKLPLATLFQAPTIDALARTLQEDNPDISWSKLVVIQPNGSRPPLFFVSGSTFKQVISRHMGPDQPFFGFEDFGLDGKRATYVDVEDLAACYIEELQAFKKHGPYLLAGFCFGGLVAYEMARQLVEQGEKIALLGLIDTVNPTYSRRKKAAASRQLGHFHEKFRSVPLRDKPVLLAKSLLKRVRRVKAKLKLFGMTIRHHGRKFICRAYLRLGFIVPVGMRDWYIVGNYLEAIKAYKPKQYRGTVVLFKSEDFSRHDTRLGWDDLVEGEVRVHEMPGTHTGVIRDDRNAEILAEALSSEIELTQMGADVSLGQTPPAIPVR